VLTKAEQHRTSEELNGNLALSGLTTEEVAADLRFTAARLRSVLDVDDADPVDVWQLRDFLEQAVRDTGRQPVAFTVLTEQARVRAHQWFALRDVPRHVSATS
jgi:hypothetical protein